ncbi:hypothetical protein [Kitasatospora sp. NPDC086791]|uniref:hypothetical protein n=1 Tax=Kitasatospora sp. NPDC086791 TaxID=3155178 RepID=UPI00342E812D
MTNRFWPTREEWAANAEHYVRTACAPKERVSNRPADWLATDELAEARALIPAILKAARAGLNREVASLRAQLGDIPKGVGWYDWHDSLTAEQQALANRHSELIDARRSLNSEAKRALEEHNTVDYLLFAWGQISAAAARVDAAQEQTDRLDALQYALAERRNTAAQAALRDAIDRATARRNSDEGWAEELERRAGIEAGPRVIRYPA